MDKCEQVVEAIKVAFKKEMEMNDIDGITFKQPVAIITVVGAEMCNQVGVAGKVFSAIGQAEVNVMAIAQGSSEVSISMVVKQEHTNLATQALHRLTRVTSPEPSPQAPSVM